MNLPKRRDFISSPGDVDTERKIAARVIERLTGEFRGRITLEPYFWEDEPMVHRRTFQEQIPHTAEFDLVICILWSRPGTPLRGPDGKEYPSGTDYEVESARAAYEATGKPELMICFNQTPAQLYQSPREERERMVRQLEALEGFVERHCVQRETGVIEEAFTTCRDLGQFEDPLDKHLRKLIDVKLPVRDSLETFPGPDDVHAIFNYAEAVDAAGSVDNTVNSPVTSTISGDARLVGENPSPATAGQTGILLQAGDRPGAITVQASPPGLRAGTLPIKSQP